ncbi:hypothetical protein TW80_12985 [Loktanella sp. S4079]|nr:hypothetical protein TW80_12985 [Loktanella sp. S4079]
MTKAAIHRKSIKVGFVRIYGLGQKCLMFGPELNGVIFLFPEDMVAKRVKGTRRSTPFVERHTTLTFAS